MSRQFLCELCFPDHVEIGELIPGYWLVCDPATGKYQIAGGQGHRGDILGEFETTPRPDLDPDCILKDDPDPTWANDALISMEDWCLGLSEAYAFGKACDAAGREGFLEFWIFERAGRLIKENQP